MKVKTSKAKKINFKNRRWGRPPESAMVGLSDFLKFDFRSFANKGSSLLETLIYAGIFIILTLVATQSMAAMTRSYGSVKISRAINISSSAAMERMAREIRLASSIDDADSVFGSSFGRLKINTTDSLGASTVIEFFSDNGALAVKEGNGGAQYLTASSTVLDYLAFDKITTPASKAVKITITVSAAGANMQRSETFYDTVILRGGY